MRRCYHGWPAVLDLYTSVVHITKCQLAFLLVSVLLKFPPHPTRPNSMFPWTKPYNLETLYEAWQDAPIFNGKTSNKDNVEVVAWLAKIAEGCNNRKVPKGLWHQVAQHYMHKKALDRLLEVEKVLKNFYGGKLNWNWERFKQAMISIRCKWKELHDAANADEIRNSREHKYFQDDVVAACSIDVQTDHLQKGGTHNPHWCPTSQYKLPAIPQTDTDLEGSRKEPVYLL